MSATEYRTGPRGESQPVVDHSTDPLRPQPYSAQMRCRYGHKSRTLNCYPCIALERRARRWLGSFDVAAVTANQASARPQDIAREPLLLSDDDERRTGGDRDVRVAPIGERHDKHRHPSGRVKSDLNRLDDLAVLDVRVQIEDRPVVVQLNGHGASVEIVVRLTGATTA